MNSSIEPCPSEQPSPTSRSLRVWNRLLNFKQDILSNVRTSVKNDRSINVPDVDLVSWTLSASTASRKKIVLADPIESERTLSKAQVIALVRHLVAGFRFENGGAYLDGDVVCVHAFNNILYPVLFQSIIGAGGCFTGTNPAYTENELVHHFKKSQTEYVITSPQHLDKVRAAAVECGISKAHIFSFDYERVCRFIQEELCLKKTRFKSDKERERVDSAHGSVPGSPMFIQPDCRSLLDLLRVGEADWVSFRGRERSASTRAALFSTSGTSGLPKIAARSHANLIAECMAIKDRHKKDYKPVRLLSVPLFHAFASPLGNITGLREGITTYVMPRFHETEFLHAIERYGVTETALVPPVILKFLANNSPQLRQQLQSIRTVWCGGAPVDAQIQDRAVSELLRPEARIVQVWGMTECGWLSTFQYPEKDDTGSVGRLLPGYQSRLLDENDHQVRHGRGEIVIKSKSITDGYIDDPTATANAFTSDGYYRTGDIGEVRDGKVYIVDRKKELIKVRGWQVAPAELEGTLLQHPNIIDAAVIGVPVADGSSEEMPEAYVVRATDIVLSEHDVKAFLLQYLARYKVLDCRILFISSIPKSASGKILRKMLRDAREKDGLIV